MSRSIRACGTRVHQRPASPGQSDTEGLYYIMQLYPGIKGHWFRVLFTIFNSTLILLHHEFEVSSARNKTNTAAINTIKVLASSFRIWRLAGNRFSSLAIVPTQCQRKSNKRRAACTLATRKKQKDHPATYKRLLSLTNVVQQTSACCRQIKNSKYELVHK